MKKTITAIVTVVLAASALPFTMSGERTVQGQPWAPQSGDAARGVVSRVNMDPDPPKGEDGNFTFDMIQSWAGEGSKKAAMVVQWNVAGEDHALVFGYRWDGKAYGEDMFRAIVEANPRLFGLIQYTGPMGYTIDGIGWQPDAVTAPQIYDIKDPQTIYTEKNGLFIHPTDKYDYDDWKAVNPDWWWQAGWYVGYWSYWVKDSATAKFAYSGLGASSRQLYDGSWDGWNYTLINDPVPDWMTFQAAPDPTVPEVLEFEDNGMTYRVTNRDAKEITLVKGLKDYYSPRKLTIPQTIDWEGDTYTVVALGDSCFYRSTCVADISLPPTCRRIGASAFENSRVWKVQGYDNLYPDITEMGKRAFANCEFADDNRHTFMVLPPTLKEIPEEAFAGIKYMANFTMGDGVEVIGKRAFDGADIYVMHWGKNLVRIENEAFVNTALSKVILGPDVESVACNVFPGSVITVQSDAFVPPVLKDDSFVNSSLNFATLIVPEESKDMYKEAPVWKEFGNIVYSSANARIGEEFADEAGVRYRITSGGSKPEVEVTYNGTIGPRPNQIHNYENFTKIDVPERVSHKGVEFKVTAVGDSAFYNVYTLSSITLPSTIKRIGASAFRDCEGAEWGVGLPLNIPDGVTIFGPYAFYNGNVRSEFPKNVEYIGDYACSAVATNKNLYCEGGIEFSDKLKYIGDYGFALNYSPFSGFPAEGTHIGKYAFSQTGSYDGKGGFETIEIPGWMTEIPEGLFYRARGVKSVKIPEGVTVIGNFSMPVWNADNVIDFSLPSTVEVIGDYAFEKWPLPSFEIPSGVKELGDYVFAYSKIEEITIPSSVSTLGKHLLTESSNLKSIVIEDGIKEIPDGICAECESLESVTLPKSIVSIGEEAFSECPEWPGINDLETYVNLEYIGDNAFNYTGTKIVNLPPKVTTLPTLGLDYLEKLTLTPNVKKFGPHALICSSALKEAVLPPALESIEGCPVMMCSTDLKVWSPAEVPATFLPDPEWGADTGNFSISDMGDSDFLPIYVPAMYVDAYKAAEGWNKSEIIGVEPSNWLISDYGAEPQTYSATLTAGVSCEYGDDVPELFAEWAGGEVASGAKLVLQYRVKGSENALSADADNGVEGKYTVSLADLTDNTDYEYRWTIASGETEYATEWKVFHTPKYVWQSPDYADGIFFVNGGQTGEADGTLSFYDNSAEEMRYRVFRNENEGESLGAESVSGQIFGDNIYVVSRESRVADTGTTGGILVSADAKTMKKAAQLDAIGGRKGHAFCGVDSEKGYLSTDNGIYTVTLPALEAGACIEGTASGAGGESGRCGDMIRLGQRVFAAREGKGVLVIDTRDDRVAATVEIPTVRTIFVTSAGELYAATGDDSAEFMRIDPESLETTAIDVNDNGMGAAVYDTWSDWHPGSVACDPNQNAVYYYTRRYSKRVAMYNFGTDTFNHEFTKLPDGDTGETGRVYGQVLYGQGVSMDPASGCLILTATEEGWSTHYRHNWLHWVNTASGQIVNTLRLEDYYWYPSMAVYPVTESAETVVESTDLEFEIGVTENATLDLSSLFSFDGRENYLLVYGAKTSDPEVCTVATEGTMATVTAKGGGTATVTAWCDYRGRLAESKINVTVKDESGVNGIYGDSGSLLDVFTVDGIAVLHNAVADDLNRLQPGVYVVKNGAKVRKLHVR